MELPEVKGRLEYGYPLKKLNTWKIGGPGELVFWPEHSSELIEMVNWCRGMDKQIFFLGRGSNVLLPDEGLKAVVIVTTCLDRIRWQKDSVFCEAGYSLMRLAREAADRGLSGLEFACSIPGSVGAAIAINAGAQGEEIGKLVEKVKVLTTEGELLDIPKEEACFAYRHSSLADQNYFVLESTLRLFPGKEITEIKETMNQYLTKRRATQPLEYPNAGSVFRNPPGNSAGQLLEEAGWKGRSMGDAQVSEKHANFIVNRGNAKSEDIIRLIAEIQEDISRKFGVELVPEIKIIPG